MIGGRTLRIHFLMLLRKLYRAIKSGAYALPMIASALISLLLFAFLETVRPAYFYTDDNITGWTPCALEICRHFWKGEPFWISNCIYGGHYNLLANPGSLAMFNPVLLFFSWIPLTSRPYIIVEAVAAFNLVLANVAFVALGITIIQKYRLATPAYAVVYLGLCHTFSLASLTLGASWVPWISGYALAPLILLGMLIQRSPFGIGLIICALVYGFFSSIMHEFIMTYGIMVLLAMALGWMERSIVPVYRLLLGTLIFLLLVSPILVPAWRGFTESNRSGGLTIEQAFYDGHIPPISVSYSLFLGVFSALISPCFTFAELGSVTWASMGYLTSSLLLIVIYIKSVRYWLTGVMALLMPWLISLYVSDFAGWGAALVLMIAWVYLLDRFLLRTRLSSWEWFYIIATIVVFLLVCMPPWLTVLFSKMPLLKSLRWPFRQIMDLHFFISILLIFMIPRINLKSLLAGMAGSLVLTAFTFHCVGAPSLNAWPTDRPMMLSGNAQLYWDKVKSLLPQQSKLLPVVERDRFRTQRSYALLGAFNYPEQFQIESLVGYVSTNGTRFSYGPVYPYELGALATPEIAEQMATADPSIVIFRLEDVHPTLIHAYNMRHTFDRRFKVVFSDDGLLQSLTVLQ
jgi:hypothetical protein